MRVLLSGTSNSVLARGVNYPLANDPRVSVFLNQSYGASGSVAVGDHLRKIDFSQYDFCVLDYCVNEEVFIWQNESSVDVAMNNMNAAIDAASKSRCQPIVLILPTSKRANHKRPFEDAIITELFSRGVPVFNFYEFAKELVRVSELEFSDLFLDPMHIRRELGQFIGQVVLDYMEQSADKPSGLEETELRYHPLDFVPMDRIEVSGDAEIVRRETKLASAKLLRIQPGAQLKFMVPDSTTGVTEIIGMTCNAARSVGSLTDPASGQELQNIKPSSLFAKARGLTLVSLPIKSPLRVSGSSAVIEYSWQARDLAEHQPDPALELAGFITRTVGRNAEAPVHIASCGNGPIALHEEVSETQMQSLAELLLSKPAK